MTLYKNLVQFCNTCKIAGKPDNNLIAGMQILSSDYKYSDPIIGSELIASAVGFADIGLEDMYGTALLAGNVYDDIEKNEELGAKLLIDAAERGNVEVAYLAAMCLIGGIGVERDLERARRIAIDVTGWCEDEQLLAIAQKSAEGINALLVHLDNDFEAAQAHIVRMINDMGEATHDDLMGSSGSRLFNPTIVSTLEIDEFDDAPATENPSVSHREGSNSPVEEGSVSAAFALAFPGGRDAAAAPKKDAEYRKDAEEFLSDSEDSDHVFAIAFELFSTNVEGRPTFSTSTSFLNASVQAQEMYVWAYALALLTGEVFDDIPQDLGSAIQLLKIGAERGIGISQYLLAACYFLGAGVDFDPESAIAYWVKSEASGFTRASEAREKVISLPRGQMQDYLVDSLKDFSNTTKESLKRELGTSVYSDTVDYMDLFIDELPEPEPKAKGFFGRLLGR